MSATVSDKCNRTISDPAIRTQRNTNNKRCFVAYIIDGVGNFSRPAAMNDMCNNSHCNVAYTPSEFDLLIEFIKEKIG